MSTERKTRERLVGQGYSDRRIDMWLKLLRGFCCSCRRENGASIDDHADDKHKKFRHKFPCPVARRQRKREQFIHSLDNAIEQLKAAKDTIEGLGKQPMPHSISAVDPVPLAQDNILASLYSLDEGVFKAYPSGISFYIEGLEKLRNAAYEQLTSRDQRGELINLFHEELSATLGATTIPTIIADLLNEEFDLPVGKPSVDSIKGFIKRGGPARKAMEKAIPRMLADIAKAESIRKARSKR